MRRQLTIGEVSKLLRMPASKIRFYEKKGLLKPGRVDESGYRLFSFQDIDTLETIQAFRQLDMSVAEMSKLLHDEEDFDYLATVVDSIDRIETQIITLQKTLNLAKRLKKHYEDFIAFGPGILHYPERELYVLDDDLTVSRSEKDMYDFVMYYGMDYTDHDYLFYTVHHEMINMLCAYNEGAIGQLDALDRYRLPEGDYYCLNMEVVHGMSQEEIFNHLVEACKTAGHTPVGEFITVEDFNTYSRNRMHLTLQIRVV